MTMAGQVLVEPAHINKMTSRGHLQPQPSCDSHEFYYSAQTSPWLSLLYSGKEIMARSWYFALSVTGSAPRYAHYEHKKVLFCISCLSTLCNISYENILKHMQNVITERLLVVISASGCPIKHQWEQILECGHERIPLHKAPSSAL